MRRSSKRLLLLVASLPAFLLLLSVLYQLGMTYLEGEPRSLGFSFEWAAETLTTTGYGHDHQWDHPLMLGFVVLVQFLGVFLVFLIFPIFLVPFFEERFESRLATVLPRLEGHIVIYRWGAAVSTLLEDLDRARVPVLILEEDEGVARRLHDRGRSVVLGSLEEDHPDLAGLADARGLIANGADHDNAVFTMSARRAGFDGTVVALTERPDRRSAMRRAGASAVFTPRHILAAAIAAKASVRISPRVSGAPMLGDRVVVGELRVDGDSPLAGQTVADSGIGARTGATVVGRWSSGELVLATPRTRLETGAIIVAAGSHESMRALAELATPVPREGPFLICGHGETGRKVAQFLTDAGERVVVIDAAGGEGVTHTGDPLDPELLGRAGVESAQAVILTLEDDSETVFAAAVVRDLAPDSVIIASSNRAANVARLHRAGADYSFSVGQVAAQLLRFQLLGEESMSLQPEVKIVKAPAGSLAGTTVPGSDVRRRTGCSIVAVQRGEDLHVELGDDLVIEAGDALYVSGTQDAVEDFLAIYGAES